MMDFSLIETAAYSPLALRKANKKAGNPCEVAMQGSPAVK
jgi:hypothetical protein